MIEFTQATRLLDSLLDFTMPHLVAVPILVPMLTAALMLLLGEQRRRLKSALSVASGLIGLLAALALLRWVNAEDTGGGAGSIGVYLPGNWRSPFGIVLVADRLSTLMVALTGVIAFAASIYSTSRWDRAGVHFHPLLQLQLMGLNGAFLTGDLFNLFVFFEVMLAASYGLLLHGSGRLRVQAGLHYIAINLAASSLFLVGAALLYGVTGTLNMADLGLRIAQLDAADRGLVHAAAAILCTAFFAKAGAWPVNFWLVPAYSAAVSPVSAVFALLTKLGIYTILRLWTLMFAPDTGASAQFGQVALTGMGLLTLAIGALGILGTQRLSNLAGYSVLISAGTLLAAVGTGQPGVWAGALYYLPSSTLAVAAFFLLIDMIERWRNAGASVAPHEERGAAPFLTEDLKATDHVNLDDEQQALYGRAIPAGVASLGLGFIACTLLLAGLPPFSGFVGKFAMLSGLLDAPRVGSAGWTFVVLLLGSGFFSLVALSRTGIRHFWTQPLDAMPALRAVEVLPVAALLAATVALTIGAGTVMQHASATADDLHAPTAYREAVMTARQIPNPAASAAQPAPTPPPAKP
ncbi:MAG: monovalent cation/H+ antiporter subunit D [Variovorax sp.]|nr:MAG: monovalent cation/H+ antiporter subunit D [Variovorax sp.]